MTIEKGSSVDLLVPFFGINDDYAHVVFFEIDDRSFVKKDQLVCVLETTKASFEIYAPEAGYIRFECELKDKVRHGNLLARVFPDPSELEASRETRKQTDRSAASVKATRKAEVVAAELGVDLQQVSTVTTGIIREQDVLTYHNRAAMPERGKSDSDGGYVGKLDEGFLRSELTTSAFKALSSDEKTERYRQHGAVIEEGVVIGDGSVIISEYIQIKRDAVIGPGSYIKTKVFKLGRMSVIGARASIVTRIVDIGDVFYSGEGILIGGGGAFSSGARFVTGDLCLVSSYCIINSGEGVILGNEVGLSPYVKLYTHNHWQSVLEGYHSNFGPIEIRDNAYITGDCIVVPGVTIGKGATVLANSTVTSDVPTRSIVVGNPAKKIGETRAELSAGEQHRIMRRVAAELLDYLESKGIASQNRVFYERRMPQGPLPPGSVWMTFDPVDTDPAVRDVVVFDLASLTVHGQQCPLSDEVRNFLRKRGIRFSPIYWRYTRDAGLYNG